MKSTVKKINGHAPCGLGISTPKGQLYQLLLLPERSGVLAVPLSEDERDTRQTRVGIKKIVQT